MGDAVEQAENVGPQSKMPTLIYAWHSSPTMDHIGTWAVTRYPSDAVEYVPRSAFLKMQDAARLGLDMARANDLWNTADKIRKEMDATFESKGRE